MRLLRLAMILLVFGLCAAARPAQAASFDCGKAGTAVEKTVCGDPALSKADEALAAAYMAAVGVTLDVAGLQAEQRQWLADRKAGASAADLLAAYQARIDSLKAAADQWRAVPTEVIAASLKTTCLTLPGADSGTTCTVEEVGAVGGSAASGLIFQRQSYHDKDLWVGDAVVLLRPTAGKADRLTPVLAVSMDEQAHYEAPEFLTTPEGTRLLSLPGYIDGTGNFNAEVLYLVAGDRFEPVDTNIFGLSRKLPKGLGPWKGIYPDYTKMTAETALWKDGDGNCCPTGGRAYMTLALVGHRIVAKDVRVVLGVKAASDDGGSAAASAPVVPTMAPSAAAPACAASVAITVDKASFSDGPPAQDPDALTTATSKGPDLIRHALQVLCAKHLLTDADIAKKAATVTIGWAGGADDFTAYFPDGRPATLATQWIWSGAAAPDAKDIRIGLLCAFHPERQECAGREP